MPKFQCVLIIRRCGSLSAPHAMRGDGASERKERRRRRTSVYTVADGRAVAREAVRWRYVGFRRPVVWRRRPRLSHTRLAAVGPF